MMQAMAEAQTAKAGRKYGEGKVHKGLVRDLVKNGCGFLRFLPKLRKHAGIDRWEMSGLRLVPDAFFMDIKNERVTCFECVVTSPVSMSKMSKYISLMFLLEEYDWDLELVIVDSSGQWSEVDLWEHLMANAKAAAT